MVGLLSLVTFGEAMACHVILCGQDPQVCSGFGRAENRWTSSEGLEFHDGHPLGVGVMGSSSRIEPGDANVLDAERLAEQLVVVLESVVVGNQSDAGVDVVGRPAAGVYPANAVLLSGFPMNSLDNRLGRCAPANPMLQTCYEHYRPSSDKAHETNGIGPLRPKENEHGKLMKRDES